MRSRYVKSILVLIFLFSMFAVGIHGRVLLEKEWRFISLTPSNLTGEKAINILPYVGGSNNDNLQISVGSESLNSAVVAENFNANQMTFLCWVKLNFVPGDGLAYTLFDNQPSSNINRLALAINASGALNWLIFDKDGTAHTFTSSITGWSVGDWHQVVVRLDFKNDEGELYIDGASVDDTPSIAFSNDSIDVIEATTSIGQDTNQANQFNGAMTFLLESRSWSDAEIVADYDSGAGTPFVVSPDTIALLNTGDTSIIYHHSGTTADNAVDNAGASTTWDTPAESAGRFTIGGKVAVQDATGYSKQMTLTAVNSGDVTGDDGAGSAVSGMEKVGVALDFDGSERVINIPMNGFPDPMTNITISFWTILDSTQNNSIISDSGEAEGNRINIHFPFSNVIRWDFGDIGAGGRLPVAWDNAWSNIWAHWAFVSEDGVGQKVYRNGVQIASDGTASSFSKGILTLGLGKHAALYYDGRISEFIICSIALTAADALWLATNPNPTEAEIISNTTVAAGNTKLYHNYRNKDLLDLTANNNDGTHSGTADFQTKAFISRNLMIDFENGGIGGHTAGDAASILSKSDVEVFKDNLSLKVLNGDGTQAFDRFAIATVANTGYRFFGRFFAPATANGASQLVDVDLTAALGITVTQAGLSAGWNDIEFAFEAADTSTTIDLGSGSVTNTEFGYWDDVRVEANLVNNGGMEGVYDDESAGGGGTVNVAPGWDARGIETDGSDTLDKETTIVHSGSASQKCIVSAVNEGIQTDTNVFQNGKYMTISFWIYLVSGGTERIRVIDSNVSFLDETVTIATDRWVKLSFTVLPIANRGFGIISLGGSTFYVDDVSLVKSDWRAASTATKGDGLIPLGHPFFPAEWQ